MGSQYYLPLRDTRRLNAGCLVQGKHHVHRYRLSSSVSLSPWWPQARVSPVLSLVSDYVQVQDLAASMENWVGPACAWPLAPEAPRVKGAVSPSSPCPVLEAEGSKEVPEATGCCILGALPS